MVGAEQEIGLVLEESTRTWVERRDDYVLWPWRAERDQFFFGVFGERKAECYSGLLKELTIVLNCKGKAGWGLQHFCSLLWFLTVFWHLALFVQLGLCLSRASASVLNLNCSLILLPMCRTLLAYLRGSQKVRKRILLTDCSIKIKGNSGMRVLLSFYDLTFC